MYLTFSIIGHVAFPVAVLPSPFYLACNHKNLGLGFSGEGWSYWKKLSSEGCVTRDQAPTPLFFPCILGNFQILISFFCFLCCSSLQLFHIDGCWIARGFVNVYHHHWLIHMFQPFLEIVFRKLKIYSYKRV